MAWWWANHGIVFIFRNGGCTKFDLTDLGCSFAFYVPYAGLICQCQTSWTWVEMQFLTEALQDSVVLFKAWTNPAALGTMLSVSGVREYLTHPAEVLKVINLKQFGPKRDLLCPLSRHFNEWELTCFMNVPGLNVWGELRARVEGKISVSKLHFGAFLTQSYWVALENKISNSYELILVFEAGQTH